MRTNGAIGRGRVPGMPKDLRSLSNTSENLIANSRILTACCLARLVPVTAVGDEPKETPKLRIGSASCSTQPARCRA